MQNLTDKRGTPPIDDTGQEDPFCGLAESQVNVAEAYLSDPSGNKVRAYMKIHPGAKYTSARAEASKLFKKPEMEVYLEKRRRELRDRLEITPETVLGELASIGFANYKDFFEWGSEGVRLKASDEIPAQLASAIKEITQTKSANGTVTLRVKLHNKAQTLELLGRHLDLFTDRVDHRHLHVHMSNDELIQEVKKTFGEEAARRTAEELGYTENEIAGLVGSSGERGKVLGHRCESFYDTHRK